jgi:hypothetical protein
MVRWERFWPGMVAALLGGTMLAGCGSPSLTGSSTPRPPVAATPTRSTALTSAIDKLNLISQDSCQTGPAEQVYPDCDRFLAELRSAVGTVRGGAAGLPHGDLVGVTSANLLAAADRFDRDGCGSRPAASGPASAQACATDLTKVRAALSTLLDQTRGVSGG